MQPLSMMHWTSPYRDHPGPSAPATPDMGPHSIGTPGPAPDMFKLVHYEARKIGKWPVHTLLECFLVGTYECRVFQYSGISIQKYLFDSETRKQVPLMSHLITNNLGCHFICAVKQYRYV